MNLAIEKVDLLADFWPHGGIAAKLGIFIDKLGFPNGPTSSLTNREKAIFVKVYSIRELPDIHELLDFLKDNLKNLNVIRFR